jgi:FAD:protein FMN transferase
MASPPPTRTTHVEHVMGTVVSFDLRGRGDHPAAVQAAAGWLHEVDARFSTYRPDSEVSTVGRGELSEHERSTDLADALAVCDAVRGWSSGAFDAWYDGSLDPSAYVKGWSVDRAAGILRAHGCDRFAINAGGDVLVATPQDVLRPWRIGIRHPSDPAALAFLLDAEDLAVATSGRYERGDHIIDPRIGTPARAAASTTVCGPDLGLADSLATAAFVLGADGPAWVAGIPGYECWTVLADGSVLATDGFPRVVHGVPVRAARPENQLGRAV